MFLKLFSIFRAMRSRNADIKSSVEQINGLPIETLAEKLEDSGFKTTIERMKEERE